MKLETTQTRRMLLETAAVVFAEHGFAATTIRMICGRRFDPETQLFCP